jgi:molecular chaperone DnaJ
MDFYVILGVSNDASTAEIKRAYRRLARQYHPGINPGDRTAEALFKRISEAYETLADSRRRREYDESGLARARESREGQSFEFTEFDFSVRAHGAQAATFTELFADVLHPSPSPDRGRPEAGADLHASLTVEFLDAIRGAERQVVVTRQVVCRACSGEGYVATVESRCPPCEGTGRVRWARGHMVFSKLCAGCGGTGRKQFETCGVCGGQGRAVCSEAVAVNMAPGVVDGARLRVPEKGHAGRRGGRTGDLYVTVHVRQHPLFRREGDNLLCVVPVAVHEAVLGTRIDVPSLDGLVKLRIPPGTQGAQRFRLSGRGAPTTQGGTGDLIVEVQLVLPAIVDERSKELMREFGQRNPENVRRHL